MAKRGGLIGVAALAALTIAAPLASVALAADDRPQRIVSLNLCTDQLLVELADRARIASVSFLAADPEFSAVADRVAGIAANRGRVEDVLALRPDLVLAHRHASREAVAMLRRLGHRVVEIDLPQDLEAVRGQIRAVAAAGGGNGGGGTGVAGIGRRPPAPPPAARAPAAAGAPPPGARPTAAIYEPSGYAFGANSLADAILRAAGYDNLAAVLGVGGYARLGLETLLASPPDLLVVDDTAADRRSMAQQLLDHPALRRQFAGASRVAVPRRLWICGGSSVADAVEMLAAARLARDRSADR